MANDTTNTTNGYKNHHISGDLSVSRNVNIGGNTTQHGNQHIKGSVKIEGWLDAKNIKGANKGIFQSESKLRSVYPSPLNGWWAIVGNSLPGDIYVGDGGEWVATGGTGGDPEVDIQAVEDIQHEIVDIEQGISDIKTQLNSLGYTFLGTIKPTDTPIALKGNEKVFYIAVEEGDYSNFGLGNISELSIIKSNGGTWMVEGLGVPLNLFLEVEEEMSLDNSLAGIYDATATTKKFISLDTFKTLDYSVTAGEEYKINSYVGGIQSAQVIFWDSTNTKISVINQGLSSQVETTFVIPDNAVEMSVCGMTSKTFTLSKIVKIPTDFNEVLSKLKYTYIGTATPSTMPVTLTGDEKVFYIATEKGNYLNFSLGNISELSIIKSDGGTWKVEGLGVPFNLFESVLKSSQTCYTTDNDAGIMTTFNSSTGESSVISTFGLDYWGVIVNFNKPITIHSALSVATFSSMPEVGAENLRFIRPSGSTIILSPEENENYILITIESKFKAIIVETENLYKRITNIEESLAAYTNLALNLTEGFYRLTNSGTLAFISSNSYKTMQMDVNSGDTYLYKAVLAATSDIAAVCFTNDDSEIIGPLYRGSNADKGNIAKGIVKVPEGVTKIAFTTTVNDDSPIFAKIDGLLNVQEELNKIQKNIDNYEPILDVIDIKSKNLYPGKYIDRALISTGGGISYADNYATTELIPILPNHYYYLSGRNKNTTTTIRCVDAEGNSLRVLAAATGEEYGPYYYMPNATATGAQVNGQFKTPNAAVAVQFIIKSPNTNSDAFNNVMLEDVGDVYDPTFEPSPYEPYELKSYIKEDALPEEMIKNITGQNKRKAPRILLIGSSHGMNTISQLPWMFYRNGYDEVYVGNVYLGSFKLQELAQRVMLNKTLSYQAFKDGGWGKDKGSLTMSDLLNKEWDVIILQRSADTCKQWGVAESTSFGYVADYITKHVKDNGLKTPRILFNSGFSDGSAGTTESIMNTALMAKNEYGVEIIPNAYAMANARNTWLKEIGTTGYLCYDNQHLDYGIGCWVASACVYEAVMRPLGNSVECISAYGTLAEQSVFTSAATESTYTEPNDKTMRIAKDCVLAAFNDNALNEELFNKYQYKNRIYVFPGWASIDGTDVDTKCVADGGNYNITFTIWSGSYLDDSTDSPVIVKVGDEDVTVNSYTQDADNRGGSISISNITDDVYIIIRTTRNPINPPA